jgi:hypothetical protein
VYYEYMVRFSELCIDLDRPNFTMDCAATAMSATGSLVLSTIESCIQDELKGIIPVRTPNEKPFISAHYEAFSDRKVHKYPEIYLNGVKYKGGWYGKYLLHAICNGFLEDDEICQIKPLEASSGVGFGTVFLIIVLIIASMVVLLICYRRIVNKALEASLNEKIQTQTIFSLGQYQVFKDDNTGRKSVDVSRL